MSTTTSARLDRALLLFDLDEARRNIRDLAREVSFECHECDEPNFIDLDDYDVLIGESFLQVVVNVIDRVEQIIQELG